MQEHYTKANKTGEHLKHLIPYKNANKGLKQRVSYSIGFVKFRTKYRKTNKIWEHLTHIIQYGLPLLPYLLLPLVVCLTFVCRCCRCVIYCNSDRSARNTREKTQD